MNREQIDRMNQDQFVDELERKVKVYDNVKGTLDLCEIMIGVLEATSDAENASRKTLISHLMLARQYALLAATDVEIEKRGLRK